MFKSWKTTLAGIITAGATIVTTFWPQHTELALKIIGIAAALGLISARDNNVPSEAVPGAVKRADAIKADTAIFTKG